MITGLLETVVVAVVVVVDFVLFPSFHHQRVDDDDDDEIKDGLGHARIPPYSQRFDLLSGFETSGRDARSS